MPVSVAGRVGEGRQGRNSRSALIPPTGGLEESSTSAYFSLPVGRALSMSQPLGSWSKHCCFLGKVGLSLATAVYRLKDSTDTLSDVPPGQSDSAWNSFVRLSRVSGVNVGPVD